MHGLVHASVLNSGTDTINESTFSSRDFKDPERIITKMNLLFFKSELTNAFCESTRTSKWTTIPLVNGEAEFRRGLYDEIDEIYLQIFAKRFVPKRNIFRTIKTALIEADLATISQINGKFISDWLELTNKKKYDSYQYRYEDGSYIVPLPFWFHQKVSETKTKTPLRIDLIRDGVRLRVEFDESEFLNVSDFLKEIYFGTELTFFHLLPLEILEYIISLLDCEPIDADVHCGLSMLAEESRLKIHKLALSRYITDEIYSVVTEEYTLPGEYFYFDFCFGPCRRIIISVSDLCPNDFEVSLYLRSFDTCLRKLTRTESAVRKIEKGWNISSERILLWEIDDENLFDVKSTGVPLPFCVKPNSG